MHGNTFKDRHAIGSYSKIKKIKTTTFFEEDRIRIDFDDGHFMEFRELSQREIDVYEKIKEELGV
jgi:hypothetical protein